MSLKYFGYRERKRHIELIWREEHRKDFLSKLLIIFLDLKKKTPSAIRVSDSELGSGFIELASWRIYAQRWETEEEVEEGSALSKRFGITLTRVVSEKSKKKALLKTIVTSVETGMADYPKVAAFLHKVNARKQQDFDHNPFLRQRYFKPQSENYLNNRNSVSSRKYPAEKTRIVINSPNSVVTLFALLGFSFLLLIMFAKGCF